MIKQLKLSRLFFFGGLVCFLIVSFLLWQRYAPPKFLQTYSDGKDFQPAFAAIKELNLKLAVYPAVLENGQWKTNTKGISYLTSSAIPGEKGNSIFYSHNWPNLLGTLVKVQNGQIIEIEGFNGEIKYFVVTETTVLSPDQTYVLGPSDDTRLTIYTCYGFLDQNRFVVTAKPLKI